MGEMQPNNLVVHQLSSQLSSKTTETDANSSDQSRREFRSVQSYSDESETSITDLSLPSKRSRATHRKESRVPFINKTQGDVNTLYKALVQSFIFSKFRYPDLLELIYSMDLVKFEAGSAVAHKDIETSDLFVVKSGKVKIEIGNTVWEEI